MTIEEIRKLSDADLAKKVYELFNLRLAAKAGQLDNGKKITAARKDIAKCLTVENERKKAASNASEAK